MNPFPVIAIDGPSASGKGAVAQGVASRLGFHYLDSGAIYRAVALAAANAEIDLSAPAVAEARVAALASTLRLSFSGDRILLGDVDATAEIRTEQTGRLASRIAALPAVRAALLARQRDFRAGPGLVADGRDMASVVFPDAGLKVFLTADVVVRARRRALQLADTSLAVISAKGLIEKENNAKLSSLFELEAARLLPAILTDLQERDLRDAGRSAAPLKQVEGAHLLDTTHLSVSEAVQQVIDWFSRVRDDAAFRQG